MIAGAPVSSVSSVTFGYSGQSDGDAGGDTCVYWLICSCIHLSFKTRHLTAAGAPMLSVMPNGLKFSCPSNRPVGHCMYIRSEQGGCLLQGLQCCL